jgi:hypothetical protein
VKLAPGLRVSSPGGASAPAAAVSPTAGASGTPGAIRLTAAQLAINRRIAQAAVRRMDQVVATFEHGLTGESFRDGSIGGPALAG